MPFAPGHKKHGGRKPGSVNKSPGVAAICAQPGRDPFQKLSDIMVNPKSDLSLQFKAAAELARYLEPQKKAVELANPEGQELRINVRYIGT